MKRVVRMREGEIAFYIKLYPLNIHPDAYLKAKAIVCEKSLELLEDAFEGRRLPPPSCEGDAVDRTIALADALGITSTPTIVLPDGGKVVGVKEASELISLIEAAGESAEKASAEEGPKEGATERPADEPAGHGPPAPPGGTRVQ